MNKNRPTQSFRVSLEAARALADLADKRGLSKSMILEEMVNEKTGLAGKPIQAAAVNDAPEKAPSKKAVAPLRQENFWDSLPTFAELLGSPKRKGPVGHAVDKALERAVEDPAKLIKDAAASAKAFKWLAGVASLGAILLPVIKERLDAVKEAKAAALPFGTKPEAVSKTGPPLKPGGESFKPY